MEEDNLKSDNFIIGADLYGVSIVELEDRISRLKDEILRLETELSKKRQNLSKAEQFFKKD